MDTVQLCPAQRSLGEQSWFQETDSFPRTTALDSIFLQGRALSTGTAPSNRQQRSSRLFETEGNLEGDHPSPPTLVTHDTSKLTEVRLDDGAGLESQVRLRQEDCKLGASLGCKASSRTT